MFPRSWSTLHKTLLADARRKPAVQASFVPNTECVNSQCQRSEVSTANSLTSQIVSGGDLAVTWTL